MARGMQDIISFSPWRREEWKGLSPDGVRKAIRYARSHNTDLQLFRLGSSNGYVAYHEVPVADWDSLFFGKDGDA